MNRGQVYSVSAINQYIKNMFSKEYALSVVFVKGEISNCKYHSSGHIYFTLKDSASVLGCVMFAGDRRGLDFRLSDGQAVIIGGTISVYERDGRYQLYAKKITLAGEGALYERYEQLKKKLEQKGYFDEAHKKKIPSYVKKVGIVTADTGAAIQDIRNISARRNPYVQLVLYPAKVQGEGASDTIVKGIQTLDQAGVDVIIVGRGGGSIEDLWAFNEENTAQAIYECSTPVISAVGHETDTTIIDFVSDLRAPTPSAAAELAVYDIRQLTDELTETAGRLGRGMQRRIAGERARAENCRLRLKAAGPQSRLRENRAYLIQLEERLQRGMESALSEKKHRMALYIEQMKGLSPLRKLSSGYSYVTDEEGGAIRSVQGVQPGQTVTIHVTDGLIKARVTDRKNAAFPGRKPC